MKGDSKMKIFSKEKEYFELFDKVAANISHAATTFVASIFPEASILS